MDLRNELIIYGYFRTIFQQDIPRDVYTICYSYALPINDLIAHITKIMNLGIGLSAQEFVGFGIFDTTQKEIKITKFDCTPLTIKSFSLFCFIPNIINILNAKNVNIKTNKQLNGIFCIKSTLTGNQIGNKNLGKSNYKRNTFLFLYDPNKIYKTNLNNKPHKFDFILQSNNKSSFEYGMSAPIYCGKKYGIIYESTFKLYQLKLQNIKGNKIKFVKMKSNGVP
eukprot:475122_1